MDLTVHTLQWEALVTGSVDFLWSIAQSLLEPSSSRDVDFQILNAFLLEKAYPGYRILEICAETLLRGLAQGSLCVLTYYKYFHHHASDNWIGAVSAREIYAVSKIKRSIEWLFLGGKRHKVQFLAFTDHLVVVIPRSACVRGASLLCMCLRGHPEYWPLPLSRSG